MDNSIIQILLSKLDEINKTLKELTSILKSPQGNTPDTHTTDNTITNNTHLPQVLTPILNTCDLNTQNACNNENNTKIQANNAKQTILPILE